MSDFKITGNPNPVVGKEEFYTINALFGSLLPNPLMPKSSFGPPVSWTIHVLEHGKWRKTKENDKTGDKVSYTFLHKSLERKGIRIMAKRGEQVARLDVKTQAAGTPKIDSVELLDKSGKKPAKPLSYGQTLKARVHCLHMEKRKVYVTLWEDDAKKGGHNKANEKNIVETRFGIVKNGKADVDFPLRPSFAKIATKAGPESDKIHEYYVTTEFNKEKIPSNNVNVNELEVPVAPFKGKTTTPAQTQPVRNNVPVQQPKPKTTPTQTKPKGVINSVNITDPAGNKIKGIFKEKQIKVWINSKGLIGKDIRLKLYDEDVVSNDLLLDQKFTIKSDLYVIVVPLDTIPRSLGGDFGEGPELELFAYVEVLQSDVNKPSAVVDVDATVFKPDPIQPTNNVMKQGKADKKDEKKDEKKTDCPNCIAPVTATILEKIFTKADPAVLEKVAKTYTDNMKEFKMDTCWNKAHFFAQVVVESGLGLHVKGGESFNWYYQSLIDTFGKFQTEEGRQKAKDWGRKIKDRRDPRAVDVTPENEKKIANWAYLPDYKTGKELGNKGGNDGWDFRGKGLVQLTGRGAYEYANKYTLKIGSDIIKNPDLVVSNVNVAVISSMAFWKWKEIFSITNGKSNSNPISIKVGNDVDGSYVKKQNAFTDVTSKKFIVSECKWKAENVVVGKWHEPVNNPISTLYMQSGGGGKLGEHWGLFGNTRSGHPHQGLDLFVEPGSDVYSCVKGVVHEVKNHSGYGKTLTIKVTDKEAFFNHRRDYKVLYSAEGEIIQGEHFDKTKDIFLFYAHLQKVLVTKGQKIGGGIVIAKSGVSGVVTGTCAPHLHFEIFTTIYAVGHGLKYRCNPGFYVHFKGPLEQSKKEKDLQKKVSESGKINEVNGKD
jgi:predicted chitinase